MLNFEKDTLDLASTIVTVTLIIDLILVIYMLVIGCKELMNTKTVMNMKTYRGHWKMSNFFVDRVGYMVPFLLTFEFLGLIFMGKACDILYETAHGFIIGYMFAFLF